MTKSAQKLLWGDRAMRIDPYQFPQTARYHDPSQKIDVSATIDENGAIIRRNPHSPLPSAVTVPAKAFVGITARAHEDETGKVTVTLELMHVDPQLSVPLLVAHDLKDVVEDWRAWSAIYKLPMMLVEEDGIARAVNKKTDQTSMKHERVVTSSALDKAPVLRAAYKDKCLGLRLIVLGKTIISR